MPAITYVSLAIFSLMALIVVYQSTRETANELCLAHSKLGGMLGIASHSVFKNERFCSYLGIRYAKPPIGDLRFKAPVPVERWNNVINATKFSPICHQIEKLFNYTESEDCLALNVFTPNPTKCGRKRLPVVASIYGGGFITGLSDDLWFGADFLMEQCVVLVTMNYRLGPFGFLSLAQSEFSGNMGLKDQQLALKWIHDNIYAFGGDKRNVTLIGTSAGGASVGYHAVNQESRKYFHRAFPMSGTPLSYFAELTSNNHTDLVIDIAKRNGRSITNQLELIDYLKNVSSEEIFAGGPQIIPNERTLNMPWAPIVEGSYTANPFVTKDLREAYENDNIDIPTIYSHTSLEYLQFSMADIGNASRISDLNDKFTFQLPFRHLNQAACESQLGPIFQEIREFYFGDSIIDKTQILAYEQLFSDVSITFSVQNAAQLQAAKTNAPVRILVFNAYNPLSPQYENPVVEELPTDYKAGHGDDVEHVFYVKLYADKYEAIKAGKENNTGAANAYRSIIALTEIIASFAKNGEPKSMTNDLAAFPTINHTNSSQVPIVEISPNGTPIIRVNPYQKSYEFWRSIEQQVRQVKLNECNH